ncbi:rod-determining factor RdfA [Halorhabdus amylolytica]|uniref:rod-determining factor RdfA n=1 Tax=Halorhabdus amylolytica TaxID=2559573 RepID=UPI0010AA7D9C|nr:rod-determining factor RdfA [Halorhabdus amylolytica]
MSETTTDRPSSKVARVIEKYGLDGMGAELEARWTAEGDDRLSLRDLADLLNRRILEQALIEAGMSTLENDVETIYHNLTADDVSTGVETDTRNRLQRNGVDVETVESNFVTYQAVRSYLKEWRGAEYEGISDTEKIEKDVEVIQRLQTRALSIAETRIENLDETSRIEADDVEVFLDMQVLCSDCGSQYEVTEFLERGGCDCSTD